MYRELYSDHKNLADHPSPSQLNTHKPGLASPVTNQTHAAYDVVVWLARGLASDIYIYQGGGRELFSKATWKRVYMEKADTCTESERGAEFIGCRGIVTMLLLCGWVKMCESNQDLTNGCLDELYG